MGSVHFRGIENVVDAYEKRNCPSWSLWQGRQFLASYVATDIKEGANQLDEFLQMLKPSGSNATYMLKIYDDSVQGKITEKTPCDGSFNFRFTETDDPEYGATYRGRDSALMQRISGLEQQLAAKGSDEDNGIIGKIAEYVENNDWAQDMIKSIAGHFLKIPGLVTPGLTAAVPTALAGVPDDNAINTAIELLKKKDAKIGEHLMKLATMEEATFNYLIGLLDKM